MFIEPALALSLLLRFSEHPCGMAESHFDGRVCGGDWVVAKWFNVHKNHRVRCFVTPCVQAPSSPGLHTEATPCPGEQLTNRSLPSQGQHLKPSSTSLKTTHQSTDYQAWEEGLRWKRKKKIPNMLPYLHSSRFIFRTYQCTRNGTRHLHCFSSLSPQMYKIAGYNTHLNRWESWVLLNLRNISKTTELVNGRAGIQTHFFLILKSIFLLTTHYSTPTHRASPRTCRAWNQPL